MYKPWATVHIFIVSFLHLLQGSDYENGSVKRTSLSALERSEQQIRRASSLEELLRITHSEDWKLWKCRLKLKSLANLDSRSASHRSTRFAAAFYDIDTLKVIDEEWQKTQCVPRETCVEVAKELGTTTNKFFKPPCVNVFRCGGCCNEESLSCMNTSTTYVSKTLFEISVPLTSVPEPVPIKIANHTGCKCLSNTQRHQYAIIRRSVQYPEEDGCPFTNKLCHNGWIWDSDKCECVVDVQHPNRREGLPPLAELAMCGQHMEFDEENCECICRQKCPTDFFQSKENCSCYLCRESQESCALKHKIFHADTCSCEDKCPSQPRTCPTAKPMCSRHCRCPKEKRGSHGSQSKESP
ncbi:Vascular endothelial growth factor D [Aptenodytes forsteri]|uniref:Vascular endothelial growth factor D n=1 Tax=Aptenodytes forsteri TaxID=9233 RepID=A0A087QXD9_APTFO|nr:PREDICTED: vascular endothelial growth factor D isoform X1 [Aptenodytes forsteri]KFM05893.1 Vascular endothelial growth factor D [Aptenodytes forsteri]